MNVRMKTFTVILGRKAISVHQGIEKLCILGRPKVTYLVGGPH